MTEVFGVLIFSCVSAMLLFGSVIALPKDRCIEFQQPQSKPKSQPKPNRKSRSSIGPESRIDQIERMCCIYANDRNLDHQAVVQGLKNHTEYQGLLDSQVGEVQLYSKIVALLDNIFVTTSPE
jgi:hypothetical protein